MPKPRTKRTDETVEPGDEDPQGLEPGAPDEGRNHKRKQDATEGDAAKAHTAMQFAMVIPPGGTLHIQTSKGHIRAFTGVARCAGVTTELWTKEQPDYPLGTSREAEEGLYRTFSADDGLNEWRSESRTRELERNLQLHRDRRKKKATQKTPR